MLNHTSKDFRLAQKLDGTSLVMGYTEAAEFLGLSPRTLERYVREGRIPYVPLPKRGTWSGVRFLRHQLLQWLEGRTVKPARANRVTSS
jgi:excisionase family DNA binding protein